MIAEAFVVGCHFGDCHYITGNVQGKIKVELAAKVLTSVGLSPKRVSFDQCSSAEGERFVKLVTDFNQGIRF
jgi:F420-non-reducing hydrogenase iron-sulfur subunit